MTVCRRPFSLVEIDPTFLWILLLVLASWPGKQGHPFAFVPRKAT